MPRVMRSCAKSHPGKRDDIRESRITASSSQVNAVECFQAGALMQACHDGAANRAWFSVQRALSLGKSAPIPRVEASQGAIRDSRIALQLHTGA